ncbi:hypothetical protein B0H63DRAFT_448546 [Podospora didyma]|uniref:Uncharacterized protein n=1 Tax=Podospora didyma TaxID=330526 RepID=A0AAE0NU55_9PEZI|nr:hypothetical protein B0H63DRAFT_448546 [Podospora didyma]
MAGEPDVSVSVCHQAFASKTTISNSQVVLYSACPVGFSVAKSQSYKPFDEPQYGGSANPPTKTFDVVASAVTCCPSGGHEFGYVDNISVTTTVHRIADKATVTLGFFTDNRVWDRRRDLVESTVVEWDAAHATVFAHGEQISYTVFHGTYTCFESCTMDTMSTDP